MCAHKTDDFLFKRWEKKKETKWWRHTDMDMIESRDRISIIMN